MQTETFENPKEPSQARLSANRKNAQLASGPKDTTKTRYNALKHRLTAKAWQGLDTPEKRYLVRRSFTLLGPRSVLEATRVRNLLQTRSEEARFLDIEREVLTRKPVMFKADNGGLFPFLHNPTALKTLEQLTRHWTALTRTGEKQFVSLLDARAQTDGNSEPTEELAEESDSDGCANQPTDPGTLDACLAQAATLILDGEDVNEYLELARGLWADLKPANTLEGFVAGDFIQTQWRLQRVPRMQEILFASAAISASGESFAPGFAFIQDTQRNQALQTLREYERSLWRRLDARLALLKKIRKAAWRDGLCPEKTDHGNIAATGCIVTASPAPHSPENPLSSGTLTQYAAPSPSTATSPSSTSAESSTEATNSQPTPSMKGEPACPTNPQK